MQKLIIASRNTGKINEIKELFEPLGFDCVSSLALNYEEVEETGQSFAENAVLKAQSAANQSGHLALADDSGFCVSALNGEPGLFSARWAGAERDFSQAMQAVWQAFCKTNRQDYSASFICALALAYPQKTPCDLKKQTPEPITLHTLSKTGPLTQFGLITVFQGNVKGQLSWPPRGKNGFGYDPVFIPEGKQQTFAEMTSQTKTAISHRTLAFKALKQSAILNHLNLNKKLD